MIHNLINNDIDLYYQLNINKNKQNTDNEKIDNYEEINDFQDYDK